MISYTLAANVLFKGYTNLFCTLKMKTIIDKSTRKFETVIDGITVGNKVFIGENGR